MSSKLKLGDRVIWCAPELYSYREGWIGTVAQIIKDDIWHQDYVITFHNGEEIHVTDEGSQHSNGVKWVRLLTPLEKAML